MVEKQPTAWIPGPPVYLSDPAPCGCEIDKLNEPHDLIDYGKCKLRRVEKLLEDSIIRNSKGEPVSPRIISYTELKAALEGR